MIKEMLNANWLSNIEVWVTKLRRETIQIMTRYNARKNEYEIKGNK